MVSHHRLLTASGPVAALVLSTGALAAQRSEGTGWLERCQELGSGDTRYCEVRELGFHPRGTIRVDAGEMGGIEVMAWGRDSVHVQARLQAAHPSSESAARDLVRRVRVEASTDGVRAHPPGGRSDGRWRVTFVLWVPRRSDLALTAYRGPILVEGVSGRMRLETHDGPLALRGVAGDVRGRTRNGPVSVTLVGARWAGRGLDVETVNGPVVLEIPADYSARLETGAVNGPPAAARRARTNLGAGGAPVRVVTENGPTTLQRTRDGGR